MVRIILRALGTTFLTLAVLGFIVLTRTDHGQGGASGLEPRVVVMGDLPEPLPGLGPDIGGAPPSSGLPAAVAALRAYLGGEAAPEGTSDVATPEEMDGVRVNLGRPSGAGDVRVNRGLP